MDHSNTLYFISKCIRKFTRRDPVEIEEKAQELWKFPNVYEEFAITSLQEFISNFGLSLTTFKFQDLHLKWDSSCSMVLLQKSNSAILPDTFYRLPKVSWGRIDAFHSSTSVWLEFLPGEFQSMPLEVLEGFSNPSFPFFGIRLKYL